MWGCRLEQEFWILFSIAIYSGCQSVTSEGVWVGRRNPINGFKQESDIIWFTSRKITWLLCGRRVYSKAVEESGTGRLKGGLSGVGEKSNSRYILKVEWKGFADNLDVCERESGEWILLPCVWSEQLEKWSLFTQEDYKRLEDQEKGGIRSIVEQAKFSVATRPWN